MFQNLVGLDNKKELKSNYKNSLKQLTLTDHGLIFRRAIMGRILMSERAYLFILFFWGGGGRGLIGILWHFL